MLIKSTTDLIASTSAANSNMNFASLRPKIESAELQYLIPLIGTALYQHVNTVYAAAPGTALLANVAALLPYLQKVVAPWALYHYVPIAEVSISDGGVFRSETETSKTAYQNQVNNLRKELMLEAQQAESLLLQYLDALTGPPASPQVDMKALWVNTPEFNRYRSLFIKNSSEFQQLFHSGQPHRNYHALRPIMYDVQNLILPKILTPDLYTRFLAEMKEHGVFAVDDPGYVAGSPLQAGGGGLMLRVCKWLAYTAVLRGIASQSLMYDERGLTTYLSTAKATNDDDSKRGMAKPNHVNHYMMELQRQAAEWQTELSFYLDKEATTLVFPEYYNYHLALTTPATIETTTPTHCGDNAYGFF